MTPGISVLKRKTKDVIRLAFSFRGVQCRETIDLPPTKSNLAYAARLRAEILGKIERGTFRYDEHFPGSPRCAVFGHTRASNREVTIRELLEAYRGRAEVNLQPSTFTGYRKAIDNVLVPRFGHLQVEALNAGVLREWIALQAVTRKRMSNLLLPLRNALAEAVADEIIDHNPIERLQLGRILPRDTQQTEYAPDPFTVPELVALLQVLDSGERNAFQAWAFTGVRTSELIALRWDRVDLAAGTMRIDMAVVEGEEKTTKTKAGIRVVPLLAAAAQALEAQRELTQLAGGRVFLNPRTKTEWTDQALLRVWQRACKLAKVRYRNPYQLRHTFASQLLSQGENAALISKLLGHKTTEMVIRNYGRWVDQGAALGFNRPSARFGHVPLEFQGAKASAAQ